MLDSDGLALRDALDAIIARGAATPLADDAFDELARRIFAYQYERIPAYAGYCRARDRTPGSVARWSDIPAVPTGAFKALTLLAEDSTAEIVFRTSGTTRGSQRRGAHHVADPDVYRASLRATFAAYLLPDDPRLRFLSLMPSADALPDSSLAFMIDDVVRTFGAQGSGGHASAGGVDFRGLDAAVTGACADDAPVLLLGTSAAFIHWLDRLESEGTRHRLPAGSRLMDTGGFKGAGRDVPPDELRRRYATTLGLEPDSCVNEYGMTEMLSQMYDRALRDRVGGVDAGGPALPAAGGRGGRGADDGEGDARRKRGPSWLRSVAVHPETLEPLPPGTSGLLRHVDLANIGSVSAIQTEDTGSVDGRGLVLEGRARGAEPRGCSIAMDTLLRQAR